MFVSKGSFHIGILHLMRVGMIRVSREVCFIAGIYTADILDNLVEKGQVSKGVLKGVKVVLLTRCICC